MHRLLACSCLTPIFLVSTVVHAETLIEAKRTTGVATSTVKSGARDDLRVTSAGSIELTGGTAITLDTANTVKNEGNILFKDSSNASGILATASSGEINNSGKIQIDETYAASDGDKDGDLDGPFSKQAGNVGIRTMGAFTGSITNSGTISIKGNQSGGILLGGPLTGNFTHSGSIDVLGDNAVGIRTDSVSGSVKILGPVSVQGANAVGVSIDGAIDGSLLIQSAVTSTGYRSITAPSDVSKLDAEDLLQGGPAVRISASVKGGILFDVRPKDNDAKDNDEDKDGIEDAKEGNASVTSYGAAPAVLIGSAAGNIDIGQGAATGLAVNGDILGTAIYKTVDATGLQIGGLGGTVSVAAGGASVGGNIGAKSIDANATALRLGAGASLPKLVVGGTIAASTGAGASGYARAISIETGATLTNIRNSGLISAVSGGDATAVAIRDATGLLTLVENTGAIVAQSKKTAVESAVAVDLSANTSGATIRQNAVASGVTAPRISGAILFGSGNDLLDLADGAVAGTTRFGAGSNRLQMSGDATYAGDIVFGAGADSLALSGTSVLTGSVDFGGGADTLAITGTGRVSAILANASGLAVSISGGTLDARNAAAVNLASLSLSGASTLGVTIDPATHSATQYQVGTANFGQGSKVSVSVANVGSAEGLYTIVKAGSMTGGANLSTADTSLPYMFKGSLAASDAAGEVKLQVARKSVTELGLSRSQSAAYDAVFKALDEDSKIAGVFLGTREQGAFKDAVQQMLPDHAGGVFETATRGARAVGSYVEDPNAMVADLGSWGFWLQQVVWGTSHDRGETAGYRSTGWGASGGIERETGIGKLGVSLAYLDGKENQRNFNQRVDVDQYVGGLHWRANWGGLNAFARGSAAWLKLGSSRGFTGALGTEVVQRTATGSWDGQLYSAATGLSYQLRTGRLTLRPTASVDYYKLHEDAHDEIGGGDAFNLHVESRNSDELGVNAAIAAGYDLHSGPDGGFLRLEVEGGRREIVGGALGDTRANFKGGSTFTLIADDRQAGWTGKLRLVGGGESFRVGAEGGVAEQDGRAAMSFRASLSVGF